VSELANARRRIGQRIADLEGRLERERELRQRAEEALHSIFTAPDLEAMLAEIERAEDDFGAMFRSAA
jgi:predicted  nucleic acid-binding Zn-ribbon protein